jgi:hypothetical protein
MGRFLVHSSPCLKHLRHICGFSAGGQYNGSKAHDNPELSQELWDNLNVAAYLESDIDGNSSLPHGSGRIFAVFEERAVVWLEMLALVL